ncbi:MAG TPA: hypothetical protein VF941_12790 [Clostridia bacterium]
MQIRNTKSHVCIPENTKFFTQFCTAESLTLPETLPDIENIVSCVVDPEILSIKTINTMKGLSYEGQYLTGKKAVIELRLKQKILYVAKSSTQSVHILENDFFQSVYIVVPCKIEGTDIEYLIKFKYLKPEIEVEDIHFNQIGERSIFKNICMMIKLIFIPTYEICGSFHMNCSDSSLFMSHEDGSNATMITSDKNHKNSKPVWSPNGREIAFILNYEGSRMLYVYCIKTCTIKRITDPEVFKSITGFCWTCDGKKLCFTACIGENKEIYIIGTQKLDYKQLTFGEGIYSSCKPKCSTDGAKIAFIKYFSGIANLWVMNIDGTESKKVTSCGGIRYFDWSCDGRNIVYCLSKEGMSDELWIIDCRNYVGMPLESCNKIKQKRKVLYSPDNLHLAFIGSDGISENVYIYDLVKRVLINLTGYSSNTNISDIIWNVDGTKIYYAANELLNFNIYSISIKDYIKTQITSTTSSKIELSYRPQIS